MGRSPQPTGPAIRSGEILQTQQEELYIPFRVEGARATDGGMFFSVG